MMKYIVLLSTCLLFSFSTMAQYYSTTTEGDYDFVPKQSKIGIVFDYSEAEMNGTEGGLDAYVAEHTKNLEEMEDKKTADKWEKGFLATIEKTAGEFPIILNDEIGKKAGVKFEQTDKADIVGTFKVTYYDNDKGMGSICTMAGVLTFKDSDGNVLAVEEYKKTKGNPSGKMGIYTIGDSYKIGSCIKKMASPLGKKLKKKYFSKGSSSSKSKKKKKKRR